MTRCDPHGITLERLRGRIQIFIADTFAARARGLLVSAPLLPDQALLILPCCSIHTFGMRYAIDVLFLDRRARVVALHERMSPWRIAGALGARAALELPAGCASTLGIEPGDVLPELQLLLARP